MDAGPHGGHDLGACRRRGVGSELRGERWAADRGCGAAESRAKQSDARESDGCAIKARFIVDFT